MIIFPATFTNVKSVLVPPTPKLPRESISIISKVVMPEAEPRKCGNLLCKQGLGRAL
jgi:hypothetical protein